MDKNPVRRIVTGHDADGKAVVLIDAPTPYVNQRGEGNVTQLLWITNESPVDLSHTRDQASQKTGVPPPKSGSVCRIVDFAPIKGELPLGGDPAADGDRPGDARLPAASVHAPHALDRLRHRHGRRDRHAARRHRGAL
jgi:hypothetical protein